MEKHILDSVQERNTEYTPSRSKPISLVGQCKVDLWELWVHGRQRLSAQDSEVQTIRMRTIFLSTEPAESVCNNEGSGLWGTATKGKGTISDVSSVLGNK